MKTRKKEILKKMKLSQKVILGKPLVICFTKNFEVFNNFPKIISVFFKKYDFKIFIDHFWISH